MSQGQSIEGQLSWDGEPLYCQETAAEESALPMFDVWYWLYDRSGYKLSRASRMVRATSAETAVGFIHADVLGRGMTAEIIAVQS